MRVHFAFLILATLGPAYADKLILRDGTVIEGTYLGGDARTIRMAVGDRVDSFSVPDVSAVQFGPVATSQAVEARPPAEAAKQEPGAYAGWETPAGTPASAILEAPAGTRLLVRMTDEVDVDSSRAGQTFRARVEETVLVNGQALIPRDAMATVKLAGARGDGEYLLSLTSLGLDGRTIDVSAEAVALDGAAGGAAGVTGGTAALVAIVAAAQAKDRPASSSAGTGPLVFRKGDRRRIRSDSRITFRLTNPIHL